MSDREQLGSFIPLSNHAEQARKTYEAQQRHLDKVSIKFEAPDVICPTCKQVLPTNGDQKDRFGNAILDEHGNAVWKPMATLVCEFCAVAALPPGPKKKRRKAGYVAEEQAKFEVPMLEIK